jgi:hypothetical protein
MAEEQEEAQLRSQIEAEIDAHGGPERYFNNLHLKLPDREELIDGEILSSFNSRRAHQNGLMNLPCYPHEGLLPSYVSKLHANETARAYFRAIGQIIDRLGIKESLIRNKENDLERHRIARPLYVAMRLKGYTHHDIVS